ncbi:hypothetical protein HDU92_004566 [Lobulomyces angularis]|nr:hypothetical protein HDU92_004566 [Lobulomyces angularis]
MFQVNLAEEINEIFKAYDFYPIVQTSTSNFNFPNTLTQLSNNDFFKTSLESSTIVKLNSLKNNQTDLLSLQKTTTLSTHQSVNIVSPPPDSPASTGTSYSSSPLSSTASVKDNPNYFPDFQLPTEKIKKKKYSSKRKEKCCPDCSRIFKRPADMRRHKQTVHDRVQNYICENCGKGFSRADTYKKHILIEEKRKKKSSII